MGETVVSMSHTEHTTDNTRRTFLQLLAGTGVATAGIGSLSSTADAASTDSKTMDKPGLTADGLVPANKFLTMTFDKLAPKEVESLDVLVDGKPTSTVQMYATETDATTAVVSVFDLLTNHDLKNGQSLPVVAEGTTSDGDSFTAETLTNVVDPTGALSNSDSGSVVTDTTAEVTETVDSTGVLSSPTAKAYQKQSY